MCKEGKHPPASVLKRCNHDSGRSRECIIFKVDNFHLVRVGDW